MPPNGAIAVVGATGAVGREALLLLNARGIPCSRLRALASVRSVCTSLPYGAEELPVLELSASTLAGCALAIFAADAETAREFAPIAVAGGAFVVDNSSAFRLSPDVPLVVPEVNGEEIRGHRLVANPNCTTIILLTALEPLRRAFGVEAIDVATYQAVSGAGLAGMEELLDQTRSACGEPGDEPGDGKAAGAAASRGRRVFSEPCAFNVFSHDSAVDPGTGVNGEERKVIDEARKIWRDAGVRITPTCVRVPVLRAHTEAITVTLREPASEAQVRGALASGAGLEIVDDRLGNAFPTPRKASERDVVLVGRLRPDPGEPVGRDGRARRWCLLACGDQLRKGAALNAIQIAELAGALAPEPAVSVVSRRSESARALA